ncbi:hypothetical protein FQA39_LY05362 [Lamprigera yunnana]|nr:hypothetical protein FQA39_LY05362 [Lamprigera yunnana]
MCPKHLSIRGKELVGSLIYFFKKERDSGGPFIPLTCVRERVAVALNLNIATASRISQSVKKHVVVQPVARFRVHTKPITNVENFCQDAIRNLIYRMYENQLAVMANYNSYYEVQPGQTNAQIYYQQNAPMDHTQIPQMPYYSQ